MVRNQKKSDTCTSRYTGSQIRLSDVSGAVRSGLYEGAIALTTLGAVSIMNRFHWEMS
jgi:hypothetical protein